MKLLHVSDLGLKNLPYGGVNPDTGLNRRFEDVYKNWKLVINEAIKNNVKYFIIAGDINEERNPESILIEKFSEGVADLISSDIHVIIIAGNHDVDSSKGTSTSISYIKSLGLINTYVADVKVETFDFDDVVFHCVPYMFPNQVGVKTNDDVTKYLNEYIKNIKLDENKYNILVSHYSLKTTFEGLDVDEPILDNDLLGKFDYVALGHIHKYEMFDKFSGGYTGSLFCKDFGEQNDKYFNIVSFEETAPTRQGKLKRTNIEKIQIPERIFKQFDYDITNSNFGEIITDLGSKNLKDCIVKIKIKAHKRFKPTALYNLLKDNGVFHYAPIEWKIIRDEQIQKLEVSEAKSDTDIVDNYLQTQPELKDDFKTKVKGYTKKIIKDWEEEQSL